MINEEGNQYHLFLTTTKAFFECKIDMRQLPSLCARFPWNRRYQIYHLQHDVAGLKSSVKSYSVLIQSSHSLIKYVFFLYNYYHDIWYTTQGDEEISRNADIIYNQKYNEIQKNLNLLITHMYETPHILSANGYIRGIN